MAFSHKKMMLTYDNWYSQHDIDLLSLWSWLYITSHSRFLERRVFDTSGTNIHGIFLSGRITALASELVDSPTTSRDCSCRSALAECITNTWSGWPIWPQHMIRLLLWLKYCFQCSWICTLITYEVDICMIIDNWHGSQLGHSTIGTQLGQFLTFWYIEMFTSLMMPAMLILFD